MLWYIFIIDLEGILKKFNKIGIEENLKWVEI